MKWNNVQKLVDFNLIKKAEDFFDVEFPESFKKIIFTFNAGEPNKDSFDTDVTTGETFSKLLSINEGDPGNIFEVFEMIKDKLYDRIIPIGSDPGGNFICLDYRYDKLNPSVVFWHHEISLDQLKKDEDIPSYELYEILQVSDNFSNFINNLKESEYSFTDKDLEDGEMLNPDDF
jgi:hypothetical protein